MGLHHLTITTVPTYANATGTLLQDTGVTIDAFNNLAGINTLTATTFMGTLIGNITGSFVGNIYGAASLNVLKTGDTMTGTLAINPLSGAALTAAGITGSAAITLAPEGSSLGLVIGSTTDNALAINGTAFTVIGTTGATTIGGALTVSGATIVSSLSPTGVVHNDPTGLLSTSLIVNADVSPSAAIAYSQLNLANSIVNADINTTAALADTKLATIMTAGTVANSATTATNAATPNTIVLRDTFGDFSVNEVTLVGTVTNPTDATTKTYVDNLVSNSFQVKTPALVGSITNVVIAGLQTVDGVALNVNDRVLLLGQTSPLQNGLWLAQSAAWTRPTDFSSGTAAGNAYILIMSGTTLDNTSWVCNTPMAIIDTGSIFFVQFSSSAATFAANVGGATGAFFRDKTGNTLNFKTVAGDSHITILNNPNDVTITTNATGTNVPSTIVARDSSGNFSANSITAGLVGNVTGNIVGNVSGASLLNVLKAGDSMTGTLTISPISGTALTVTGVAGSAAIAVTPAAASNGITISSTTANAIAVNTNAFTVVGSSGNTSVGGTLGVAGATTLSNLSATGIVHTNTTGLLSTSLIVNADVDPNAALPDSKLASIVDPGTVANSATTATGNNSINTIVARDSFGNFSANVITAGLVGNVTGNVFGNISGTITGNVYGNVVGNLLGNVIGNVMGNVVGNVTGASSLNVLKAGDSMTGALNITPGSGNALTVTGVAGSAAIGVTPAAASNGISIGSTTANAIAVNTNAFTVVGSSGNTNIGGTLGVLGATTLSNLSATGIVHTNTTGLLSTSLMVNADVDPNAALPDSKLASIVDPGTVANSATTATGNNSINTIVARDASGNFSANNITAGLVGTVTTNNFIGNVTGAASLNVLKAGDSMTGTLTLPDGSAASPSLNFANMNNTGFFATGPNALGLSTSGTTALFANATGIGINTTAPYTQLVVPGSTANGPIGTASVPEAQSIYVQGRYAYIASINPSSLQIFDVSNPSVPTFVGSLSLPNTEFTNIYVQGRYAYCVTQNTLGNNLLVIDISNPASPVLIGSVPIIGRVTASSGGLWVQGRYAYVLGLGFQIFDITNPAVPTLIGQLGINGQSMYVQGDYAYILSGFRLMTVNIRNPTAPVFTFFAIGLLTEGTSIYVQGRYAYIVAAVFNFGTGALIICDVSDPDPPMASGHSFQYYP